MTSVILAIVGLASVIWAWAGYGVPDWLSRDVLWLAGVIEICTALVTVERR